MTDYRSIAIQAAQAAGIDPNIFVAQIQQESGFNPNAKSPAGAEGIAQFMPGTASGLGVNPWDPVASLYAAARLDKRNLSAYGGDWSKALAAYNAGGGAVNIWISKFGSNWLSHAYSETQNYVKTILANAGTSTGKSGTGTGKSGTSTDTNTIKPDTIGQGATTNNNGIIETLFGVPPATFQQFMLAIFAGLIILVGIFAVFKKKEVS